MCLSGSCSGRVTEVDYGSIVVWKCIGVGSGRDKQEMVVYGLMEGVGLLLPRGLSQGAIWHCVVGITQNRTGFPYTFVLF